MFKHFHRNLYIREYLCLAYVTFKKVPVLIEKEKNRQFSQNILCINQKRMLKSHFRCLLEFFNFVTSFCIRLQIFLLTLLFLCAQILFGKGATCASPAGRATAANPGADAAGAIAPPSPPPQHQSQPSPHSPPPPLPAFRINNNSCSTATVAPLEMQRWLSEASAWVILLFLTAQQ
jgi:hypothetical protein